MTDHGDDRKLAEAWQQFAAEHEIEQASELVRAAFADAFYAGALAVFGVMMDETASEEESGDAVARMCHEAAAFADARELLMAEPVGSA